MASVPAICPVGDREHHRSQLTPSSLSRPTSHASAPLCRGRTTRCPALPSPHHLSRAAGGRTPPSVPRLARYTAPQYGSYVNYKPSDRVDLAALLHAAQAVQHEVEAKLGAVGLSLAKLAALKALAEGGESMPLTQLAERLSCVKSNITQLVDRLEADGLVERQSDPNDRRARLATLTPAGRKAWREGLKVQQAADQKLHRKLTAAESRLLATLLAKVAAT